MRDEKREIGNVCREREPTCPPDSNSTEIHYKSEHKSEQNRLLIFPNALSESECQALIDLSEAAGYSPATIEGRFAGPRGFNVSNGRYNHRSAIDDTAMACALWRRLHRRMPAEIDGRRVVSLNERLRFYRYDAGESFPAHTDGYYLRDNGELSILTLMIYLNADYSGGETFFLESERLIVSQTGTLLLFGHSLWHEGREVREGRKYILRTDVMYGPTAS